MGKKPLSNRSAPGTVEEQARLIPDGDIIFIGKLRAVYMDMSIAQLPLYDSCELDSVASEDSLDVNLPLADRS